MSLSEYMVTIDEKKTVEDLYGFYLREVHLYTLNGKPINENENAAWEIIKGAYCLILQDDEMWHFFYEGPYNIIRCQEVFYESLLKYLQECGVGYVEKGLWYDGSETVRNYKKIYMPLFHNFSIMALQEYHWTKIKSILDRVVHCFLNHQHFTLGSYREIYGRLWEARLIVESGVFRADYVGYCNGVELEKRAWQKWGRAKEEKIERMGWFKKFLIKKVFKLL